MIIGVPKEIKQQEYRVGLTPQHAEAYVKAGHTVYVQSKAGVGAGYSDRDYERVGCKILPNAVETYKAAEMIIKVKEPLEAEYPLIREGQILYTYFHLAADKPLTEAVLNSKCVAIAYETIRDEKGGLPCLKPMSEIAGRLAIQEGAKYLEKHFGGNGVLLGGGVTGVLPSKVLVLGGAGTVGSSAVAMAAGMRADVTAVDVNLRGLADLEKQYQGRVKTLYATESALIEQFKEADLIIGATLIPGASTPQLIHKDHIKYMKKGAVIVDVAIDQGGTCQTSHVTYHNKPVFTYKGVVHYCVGNMPGAVPYTSTVALNNATLKYGLNIAKLGYKEALKQDKGLMMGLNADHGKLTIKSVADEYGIPYVAPETVL